MKKLLLLLAMAFYVNANAQTPTAYFSMPSSICFNNLPPLYGNEPSVSCVDSSSGNPTSWFWTITPNTNVSPSTSNLQNPTFTFSNTGTYTVQLKVSNANGSDSITKTINILGAPSINVVGGIWNFAICSGSGINIDVYGANTYTWSPANGLNTTNGSSVYANPSSATNYTILGTNTDGCIGTMTVEVWPNPSPTITVNSATICAGQQVATLTANGANTYSWIPSYAISANTGSPIMANPLVTTIYTVTGTDANGCTNYTTTTVSVNAAPVIDFSAAINSGCSPICTNFTSVSSSTLVSWYWQFGNGASSASINPHICYTDTSLSQALYTVTLTVYSNQGCSASLIKPNYITVNPAPTVSFSITPNATPHVWDVIPNVTGGTAPYSYLWNWGDGSSDSSTSHTYSVAAFYNVCLQATDANGCSVMYCQNDSLYRTSAANSIIQLNVVNASSGISQVTNNNKQLSVYPNPASSIINVSVSSNSAAYRELAIYDVLGKEVIKTKATQIDVSSLPNGIYFIKAGSEIKKFIKQ